MLPPASPLFFHSGGHFNPAVSLSVCFIGGLNVALLVPYILAQLCGGIIGAGLAKVGSLFLLHITYP